MDIFETQFQQQYPKNLRQLRLVKHNELEKNNQNESSKFQDFFDT